MYILIRIGQEDTRTHELVSKTKDKLIKHLKEIGYHYSTKCMRYIDDKTTGINGGSGTDYLIDEIDVL